MTTYHKHDGDLELLAAMVEASRDMPTNGINLVRRVDGSVARFRIRNGATLNGAMPEDAGLSDTMPYIAADYCDKHGYTVAHVEYGEGSGEITYMQLRK